MKKTHKVYKRNLFRKEDSSVEMTPQELVQVSSKENGRKLGRVQYGAHALRRRYLANLLDGRSKMGMWTRELERDFCQHLGFATLDDIPITARLMVQSIIADWLLLCTHHAGQERHMFDLRACMNSVLRSCKELGLKPTPKPVQDLQAYLKEEGYEVKQ